MNLTMPFKAPHENVLNGSAGKLDEIRKALSHEADQLAHVAAQTTHNVAAASHEPLANAGSLAQSLIKGAAELGTAIAATGRKTAADLGSDAKAVASDLGRVRLTKEPRKTGPDFMPGLTLLGGFGAGIALMYFLDPEKGQQRRTLLRDKLARWTRLTSESLSGKARDLGNRASGAAYEARKAVESRMPSGDEDGAGSDYTNGSEYSNGSAPATGDPSTTDTWGEQSPSNQSSRIEIS